ncbi:MAG: RNA polymerase sigma factor [Algicola sp.]|nr:RNA polymerase sigma factor [Algicola sp.]
MNIDKLIKLCKKNNINAQSELYKLYKNSLYSLCLKYSRNKEDAQDTLQEGFIIIFQSIKKYQGVGSFEGWMKRIVINKAIDKYKSESFINVIVNEENLQENDTHIKEFKIPLDKILKLIQELPSRYRLIFNLYELDHFSHKEISKMLSISEGTSKSNLHRAKLILKEKIRTLEASRINKIKISNGN